MGYKEGFAGKGWDSIWTDMSEIVRPTRDGVYGREYISTLTDLGRKPRFLEFSSNTMRESSRTIELGLPIIFDYLPDNLNSQSIISSIADAARRTGTLFIASRNKPKSFTETYSRHMMPLLSPSDIAEDNDGSERRQLSNSQFMIYDAVALIRKTNPTAPISVRLPLTKDAGRNDVTW